jgi:hypothetical protein
MNTNTRKLRNVLVLPALFFLAATGCKKLDKPELGTYPADANPPGGPLKFYVAFDGTSANSLMNAVDSTRANFPSSNTGSVADGISGKSYKGSSTAFAQYSSANEFTTATSLANFTIAFWIKKTPQAAGTNFAFTLNTKDYSWTNAKLFFEFEDAGQSTTALAAGKFYLLDNWVEYVGANRMPNVLDGSWHHLAFTYSGTGSELKAYIDGALFKTNTVAAVGNVTFGTSDNFTIGGPNAYTHSKNDWMGFWDGNIDQFRIYSTVLTQADIQSLFVNKK